MSEAPSSPTCPICTMTEILQAKSGFECATCGHEWEELPVEEADAPITDANGNVLKDGDSVTVTKDLKVKGSTLTLKAGTKIKGIRLVPGDHDVDCKVDGMGVMLKSKFLKKA